MNASGGGKSESNESRQENGNEGRMKAQDERIAECFKAIESLQRNEAESTSAIESLQRKEAESTRAIERLEGQNRANIAAHKDHLAHCKKAHESLAKLMRSRRSLVI